MTVLRETLAGKRAMAFGISGALAGPLITTGEVVKLIRAARDAGLEIFDTAPAYGAGVGESRLGEALVGDNDAVVMTRVGVTASGLRRRHRDFSSSAVIASVEASLRRLRRERIDVLWLHGPARGDFTENLSETCRRLVQSGKVGHIGAVLRRRKDSATMRETLVEAVMLPINPLLNEDERQNLAEARDAGPMIFAIECLFGSSDVKSISTRGGLWRLIKRMSDGRTDQRKYGAAWRAHDAFDFTFNEGGADVAVFTTTNRKHLEDNARIPIEVSPAPEKKPLARPA